MFKILRIAVFPLLFLAFSLQACRDAPPTAPTPTPKPTLAPASEPHFDVLFTSTREIRDLYWSGASWWAATGGGIYRNGSTEQVFTGAAGLPSNEVFEIGHKDGKTLARFPVNQAVFDGQKWKISDATPFGKRDLTCLWSGQTVRANSDVLQIGARKIALPPSTGTHISALLPSGGELVVAMYGDGLWRFDGKKWRADARNRRLSPQAREITAMAYNGANLLIGTRRGGIFYADATDRPLTSHQLENEPFNANIQNLGEFGGVLWGSTLDDGLIFRAGDGSGGIRWGHVSTPILSSSAPRQLFEWKNRLFVRHGGGIVDAFDGQNWHKDALKTIPRKGVYALAGDENRLYASGWGGWSEWDEKIWVSHYDILALKGVPILGIWAAQNSETVWIATQSRGVGRWIRQSGEFRFFDERDGLEDDWITTLLPTKNGVWAGTFVGGLAHFDGEKWMTFPELKGENVTSLAETANGVVVATRRGLWRVSEEGIAEKVGPEWLEGNLQALWNGKSGLWIGGRTSLTFWKIPK